MVMYKLEPVIAEGGRLSMDALYIDEVSYTWGSYIEETGHHVGRCKNGVENPRIDVTLATSILEGKYKMLNLDYMNKEGAF